MRWTEGFYFMSHLKDNDGVQSRNTKESGETEAIDVGPLFYVSFKMQRKHQYPTEIQYGRQKISDC